MRGRSITGPIVLITIGALFLLNNVLPEISAWRLLGDYWPFLLIGAGVIGLVEVLFVASRGGYSGASGYSPQNPQMYSPRYSRAMGGGWVFWLVFGLIMASVVQKRSSFRFQPFQMDRISFPGPEREYDVNIRSEGQGASRVVLDGFRGDVTVRGADSGEVKVTGKKRVRGFLSGGGSGADSDTQIHLDREGDAIVVRTTDGRGSRRLTLSADLQIVVPSGFSVESRGRAGDLTVEDVDGAVDVAGGRGDVTLSRVGKNVRVDGYRGGDLHVAAVKGDVELRGRGGDVDVREIAGGVSINGEFSGELTFKALAKPFHFQSSRTDFRVEAVPGSVTMDLGDLKLLDVTGPVVFRSGTRDISAKDITGSLELALERGDIQVSGSHGPLPKMNIHTRNGDIELGLPVNSAFHLEATTSQGDVRNEFGSPLETRAGGRVSSIVGQSLQGGGGVPDLKLSTERGDVTVRKN